PETLTITWSLVIGHSSLVPHPPHVPALGTAGLHPQPPQGTKDQGQRTTVNYGPRATDSTFNRPTTQSAIGASRMGRAALTTPARGRAGRSIALWPLLLCAGCAAGERINTALDHLPPNGPSPATAYAVACPDVLEVTVR